MRRLTIDLESRSEVDLKKAGMYRYAEDPSTDILCFAFKFENSVPMLWIPPKFTGLIDAGAKTSELSGLNLRPDTTFAAAIDRAHTIEAHNAGFEMAMWAEIMVKRYGFSPLPLNKMRCSAAKVASFALPRALGQACSVLHAQEQKDSEGYKIMLRMCKPRRPSKTNPSKWHEDPSDFIKLCRYCLQDIKSEESLSTLLPEMPDSELAIWRLDQIINTRGLRVDLKAIENLIRKVERKEKALLAEVAELTDFEVGSVRQIAATTAWLARNGVHVESLNKTVVEEVLTRPLIAPKARRLLEIRQMLGKSSVSKLTAMQNMACSDERVKGTLLYHGASTGRWAGKGIQTQNLPRDSYGEDDVDNVVALDDGDVEFFYDDVFRAASRCVRGMIIAGEGRYLRAADFSSIEARVLAWVAGEQKVLDAFRRGLDLYKVNAMDIFGVGYDDVDKEQRQIGKISELALGYQGWLGAFTTMAELYGVVVEEERAKEIILAWRRARPNTVALWRGLEMAAIATIRTKKPHAYGRIKFGIRGRFLHMRLPSGRLLSYCDPSLKEEMDAYGRLKMSIRFMGVDSLTKKWVRQATFGGKLTENCIQAIARDLLAEAMLRVEKAGWPIVFHVHDEIICEHERNDGLEEFENLMAVAPDWAKGLPISAEGWIGKRHRK